MSNLTIANQWGTFAELVMPKSAPDSQRVEMRRAFYAGFHGAITMLTHNVGGSKDEGVALLQALEAEAQQFARRIAKGEA